MKCKLSTVNGWCGIFNKPCKECISSKCKFIKKAYRQGRVEAEYFGYHKREWIPVSERLPKAEDMYQPPEQRYLCQLEAYGERKFCVLSRLKGAISPFWDWYGVAVHDSEVIAWMPLPEPYREDGEDE